MTSQGYARFPTVFHDTIVFTAEDDLWRVPFAGGRAERLTAGVASATHARFSPDGSRLAFTGRDEGPSEVYVMDADGGPSQRLTFQGVLATVNGWRPDGSMIIYSTSARQPSPRWRTLGAVAPTGGEPVTLPYGIANAITFGPNGIVVLGRHTGEPANWKRYRGGTAGKFWIDRFGNGDFIPFLATLNTNLTCPLWLGDRCYFISDHEGIGNVYSVTATGEDLRRHTALSEHYARNLSGDGRRAVFHAGGDLYALDATTGLATRLSVELPGSRAQTARRFVSAALNLETASVHPRGHSLAITTRGKAFSLGNWDGAVTQYGDAVATRYRLLTWLADGKRLAAISDDGTEPRLAIFAHDDAATPQQIITADLGTVVELAAAPKGDLLAAINHRNEVLLVDVAAGTTSVADRSAFGRTGLGTLMRGLAWSPDGAWLAYAMGVNAQQTAIKLCRVATGETYQVTNPVRHDMLPAFDPAGRYLYFLSARTFDPVGDNLHFDLGFPKGIRPYLITLRRDLPSPFYPLSPAEMEDLIGREEREEDERAKTTTPPDGSVTPPDATADASAPASDAAPLPIDLDGIAGRIVAFPVPEGRYGRVQGTPDGALFSVSPVEGTRNQPWPEIVPAAKSVLFFHSFERHKQEVIVDGITDFEVSANGRMVLYRAGDRLRVLKAGEKPNPDAPTRPGRESGWIDLNRVKVSLWPAAEWRQMFGEAWRLQREQFWVADMGGVDWPAVRARYAPLVERVASRGEFSDVIWETQGELGSSHAYEMGGDYRAHPEYRQGFLGADWSFDAASGGYRVAHIVRGDPWDGAATSPLLATGVNVGVGDVVLAINGQRLDAARGPQQALVFQADHDVRLLVRPAESGETRHVTVRALGGEFEGRYRDWVEGNRSHVHAATGNRVGYLHVPDMSADGFAEFHRYFLAEYDYDGLIVDVRWNGGGSVSGLLLEKLARKRLGYDYQRWGPPAPYPAESPRGTIIALTNENAGSDGDIFSHAFKMLGLGPLVGKRTWGGVIGIEPYIALADGTVTTQPEFSFWFKDVGWNVENYGTDPTIEVDYRPQDYANGSDPQLERAIQEALARLNTQPDPVPTPGPHPNRGLPPTGRG